MKKLTTILSASLCTPIYISVLALGTFTASGCAVATAGVKKGDERNFARSLHDVNAARAIRARMMRTQGFQLKGVDVEVAEGIVLLSGNVPRPEDRVEAERIAWSADKIVQVGNEVRLMGKQGSVRNIKDGALHQSVRARLIATKTVKARNYNIEVHDGIVYLLGVARSENELATAAHIASTTRGTQEVVSYVRITEDLSAQYAQGPGYNGQPSEYAANGQLVRPDIAPIPYTPPSGVQNYRPQAPSADAGVISEGELPAIDSGEPYYLDPKTGERVEIPEGVTPIPYVPDTGPGSLGAGGAPVPLGAVANLEPSLQPSLEPSLGTDLPQVFGSPTVTQLPTSLPSDDYLGQYRAGQAGEAVSVIESAPYRLDPLTGDMLPVKHDGTQTQAHTIK